MTDTKPTLSREHLLALVDLAPELTEDTSLRSLLDRLLSKAVALTSSTSGSVYLYDDRRRTLYVAHAVGPEAAVVLERYGAVGSGIPLIGSKAGGVFSSGEPILENEVSKDPEHYKAVDAATALATKSMIAVPLVVTGERIGVVQLLNRTNGPYSVYDLVLLERFATLAAVALRNAQLVSDLATRIGAYGLPHDSVDAAALRRFLNAPAQSERLSVLFADMRRYSRLENTLRDPALLQSMLNEFLAMLSDAVFEQGGVVNKFLGDGVMALFRGSQHAVRAVRSAQAMVERFEPMRERWGSGLNESLSFLDVGVGVATDTVTLCTVGNDRVREFTAVGRAVNLAALLVDRARGGHRLLTDRVTFNTAAEIIDRWSGPTRLQIESTGPSGSDYEVYEVLGLKQQASEQPAPVTVPRIETPRQRPQVFISYAHTDSLWLDEVHTHLRPFLKHEDFELWDDTRIAAGQRWRAEIETALARAAAAVLLVTPKFLSSEFIDRHELPPLFEAARKRGLRIFWLPCSASAYDQTEIAGFQALHDPRVPLDQLSLGDRNAVLVKVCGQIAKALKRAE